ncbi:MAG TPA: GNAT family N-acetyltransferase [Gemmatimonadaceae bacterium]|nr:GNAT family N-acetyltransferase [Gemmatimonadaceae bacterium]
MSLFSIRDATANDADALARLVTQLGYPADPSAMPARIERLTADAHTCALVAVNEDVIVGMATVQARHTLNHEAPIAQLTLLVVDETIRSQGVGRALVNAAERWAAKSGCKRIVVTTQLSRAGAHAFYERLAYQHTGRRYGKELSKDSHAERMVTT